MKVAALLAPMLILPLHAMATEMAVPMNTQMTVRHHKHCYERKEAQPLFNVLPSGILDDLFGYKGKRQSRRCSWAE